MIVRTFEDRESWEQARLGRITGSKLKDLIVKKGTGKKIGFYQLIADRLALPPDDEKAMDRGTRLEEEALERFNEETGLKAVSGTLTMWVRDDNENIAISPDGIIGDTEAVEIKCLNSARHIEALITKNIPADYVDQVIQYFIVNEKLETLYFVFYDSRLLTKQFFFIPVSRDMYQAKIDEYLMLERAMLAEVDDYVAQLSNF